MEERKRNCFDYMIAMVPAGLFGIFYFGKRSLWVILLSVLVVCLLYGIVLKVKKKSLKELSLAVYMGMFLAYSLPAATDFKIVALGALLTVLFMSFTWKENRFWIHPALGARMILQIFFNKELTTYIIHNRQYRISLSSLKIGNQINVKNVFFGTTAGTIGETCVIALGMAALYLFFQHRLKIKRSIIFGLAFVIAIGLTTRRIADLSFLFAEVCSGGLLFLTVFVLSDEDFKINHQILDWICPILVGLAIGIFRTYGPLDEPVYMIFGIASLLIGICNYKLFLDEKKE